MRNNFVEKKKTFFGINGIFQKVLTHAFGQKIHFFPLFVFGQNKARNKV